MVLHSGTKFLGGHGDVMAGIIACDETWARRLRQVQFLTGGNLHPTAAYTLHEDFKPCRCESMRLKIGTDPGLETQWPSISTSCVLPSVAFMRPVGIGGPSNDRSWHHGFDRFAWWLLECKQDDGGCSTGHARRDLGSCDTLIQHPAGLTHRVVDPDARNESGIGPGLLRHVGLEDVMIFGAI